MQLGFHQVRFGILSSDMDFHRPLIPSAFLMRQATSFFDARFASPSSVARLAGAPQLLPRHNCCRATIAAAPVCSRVRWLSGASSLVSGAALSARLVELTADSDPVCGSGSSLPRFLRLSLRCR
jgi:hypothetical protein